MSPVTQYRVVTLLSGLATLGVCVYCAIHHI